MPQTLIISLQSESVNHWYFKQFWTICSKRIVRNIKGLWHMVTRCKKEKIRVCSKHSVQQYFPLVGVVHSKLEVLVKSIVSLNLRTHFLTKKFFLLFNTTLLGFVSSTYSLLHYFWRILNEISKYSRQTGRTVLSLVSRELHKRGTNRQDGLRCN